MLWLLLAAVVVELLKVMVLLEVAAARVVF
jgi:hypothetical protein